MKFYQWQYKPKEGDLKWGKTASTFFMDAEDFIKERIMVSRDLTWKLIYTKPEDDDTITALFKKWENEEGDNYLIMEVEVPLFGQP